MTGKDIIVVFSQNGTALADTAIKSDSIKVNADVIEKASATQQAWKEYIAGRNGWTLSTGYLVLASAKIRDVLMVGQTFDVTVRPTTGNTTLTGKAIMTDCEQVYNLGNLIKGTFSFQGTGPLS